MLRPKENEKFLLIIGDLGHFFGMKTHHNICAAKYYFVRKEILKIIFNNESNEGFKNDKEIHNYLNKLYIKEQFKALQSAEEILNNSCIVMKTEGQHKIQHKILLIVIKYLL
jgi:hypothetical protein